MAATQQAQAKSPNNKYKIITVNLMDLPKQIEKWDTLNLEADRYEYFPPIGSYVLFLRPKTTDKADQIDSEPRQ